ncbi:hypothetical protein RJP21_04550 [Paenibacillus sp. VCA1]|uniref:hypothetical protein n=1 Tax=Paenibacillus sp. VCA1 TaxID=3039148 RepID=UPI0028725196|nr:hypothetical protein [Paenibacillus sp. VCA1]MDR9852873.1 hypothetical protein [Paenibacillus sp. VCA1]
MLKDVFLYISSVLGIVAFIFTVIRFIQDNKRIAVSHTIKREELFETLYDRNHNEIGKHFLEDYKSIELVIKNVSTRPISILRIQHDSDFEFNDKEKPYTLNTFDYHKSEKILVPGGVFCPEGIAVSDQLKKLNIQITTTYYTYKQKLTIRGN